MSLYITICFVHKASEFEEKIQMNPVFLRRWNWSTLGSRVEFIVKWNRSTKVLCVSLVCASVFQVNHELLQFARDQLVVSQQDCAQTLRPQRKARQRWTHHWPLLVQKENTTMKIVLQWAERVWAKIRKGGWTSNQKWLKTYHPILINVTICWCDTNKNVKQINCPNSGILC